MGTRITLSGRRLVAVVFVGLSHGVFSTAMACAATEGTESPGIREPHERAFDDLRPIRIDLDGDGRRDLISPRITEFRRSLIPGVARFAGGKVERLVTLDLETAAGRTLLSIFRFRFGTENGGYRRFEVASVGDADGDGRGDLLFRVGGELPEETIVLLDRGGRFTARSSGALRCRCTVAPDLSIVAVGSGSADGSVLGRWRPAEGRFVGERVVWVVGAEAAIRDQVGGGGALLGRVEGGSALRRIDSAALEVDRGWLAVELEGLRGWISARVVADRSPLEEP